MAATPAIVNERLDALRALCRKHHVAQLELFGSATTNRFDIVDSDLDFLVSFEPLSPTDRADAYFGLLESLQDLYKRNIDLVEAQAVDNPYFLRSINSGRTVLYAA
jgi:predicted nucleotidyltransferase